MYKPLLFLYSLQNVSFNVTGLMNIVSYRGLKISRYDFISQMHLISAHLDCSRAFQISSCRSFCFWQALLCSPFKLTKMMRDKLQIKFVRRKSVFQRWTWTSTKHRRISLFLVPHFLFTFQFVTWILLKFLQLCHSATLESNLKFHLLILNTGERKCFSFSEIFTPSFALDLFINECINKSLMCVFFLLLLKESPFGFGYIHLMIFIIDLIFLLYRFSYQSILLQQFPVMYFQYWLLEWIPLQNKQGCCSMKWNVFYVPCEFPITTFLPFTAIKVTHTYFGVGLATLERVW